MVDGLMGYLLLTNDGAVLESGGDLENDERSASIIVDILLMRESIDENFMPKNGCEVIILRFEDHTYNIALSNTRIYVRKFRCVKSKAMRNGEPEIFAGPPVDGSTILT